MDSPGKGVAMPNLNNPVEPSSPDSLKQVNERLWKWLSLMGNRKYRRKFRTLFSEFAGNKGKQQLKRDADSSFVSLLGGDENESIEQKHLMMQRQ